ncbi:unnamed protein product [Cladocopium goreaui]|uniref:Uncharacterized protein n=1 Tax=Cladocopium goreaui TaxID=2562237 RepID=A0A9P1FJ44_9DINO|nr:unnamed protein product [Cladocopium goreaui]
MAVAVAGWPWPGGRGRVAVAGRPRGWPWPGGRVAVAGWPWLWPGRWGGWPGGRMAGWPDGRMAGWPDGRLGGWAGGRVGGCGRVAVAVAVAGWPVGRDLWVGGDNTITPCSSAVKFLPLLSKLYLTIAFIITWNSHRKPAAVAFLSREEEMDEVNKRKQVAGWRVAGWPGVAVWPCGRVAVWPCGHVAVWPWSCGRGRVAVAVAVAVAAWPRGRVAGWPGGRGRGRGRGRVAGWPGGRVAGWLWPWPWPGRGRGRDGRQLKKAIVPETTLADPKCPRPLPTATRKVM